MIKIMFKGSVVYNENQGVFSKMAICWLMVSDHGDQHSISFWTCRFRACKNNISVSAQYWPNTVKGDFLKKGTRTEQEHLPYNEHSLIAHRRVPTKKKIREI